MKNEKSRVSGPSQFMPSRLGAVLLTALSILGILLAPAFAQSEQDHAALSAPPPPIENMQAGGIAPAAPDSYRIGADDLLAVFVYQMPDFTAQVRVNQSGMIRLPAVKTDFQALGKTAPALAQDIASELEREGLAVAPQVQVIVRQIASRPIVVTGAVKTPVVIQAAHPITLAEAIARAGGLTSEAGTVALVGTKTTSNGYVSHTYDLSQLNTPGSSQNPYLKGGDTVEVQLAQMVYVIGSVTHPGGFPLRVDQPITALRALALAQGILNPADLKHSEIIRVGPNGQRQEVPINLDAMLKHRASDVGLRAGDMLFVPENGRSKVINNVVQATSQIAVIALGYNANKVF